LDIIESLLMGRTLQLLQLILLWSVVGIRARHRNRRLPGRPKADRVATIGQTRLPWPVASSTLPPTHTLI